MSCPLPVGASSVPQVFLFIPGQPTSLLLTSDAAEQPGNKPSGYSMGMNASGLSMAFESQANNIDPDDHNNVSDIFVLVDTSILGDVIFEDGFEP